MYLKHHDSWFFLLITAKRNTGGCAISSLLFVLRLPASIRDPACIRENTLYPAEFIANCFYEIHVCIKLSSVSRVLTAWLHNTNIFLPLETAMNEFGMN